MAKKNAKKAEELKEVSRKEINGIVIITFEDGSVKIIPAPICLTKEQAEDLFGSEEEDDEDDEEEVTYESLFKDKGDYSLTIDKNHYIWIVWNDGSIWRGRLNKLGFKIQ